MGDREVKVLLIEDNPVDAGFIQALLAETRSPWSAGMAFDVARADRLSTGLSYLTNGSIGLVLLDLTLPDSRGLDTLIRVRGSAGEVPIVVLTSRDDESLAISALQQGAQDYLVKGSVNGPSLSRAVRYAIERNQVEAELRKAVSLLSATLESTADGILVVDTDGTVVRSNQKLRDMWGLPDRVTGIKTNIEFLNLIREKLSDAEGFVTRMELMQARPDEESLDVVDLKDGRIFERYSPPQRIADDIVGRVWSFRDVTARKRAEEELKKALQWQEEIFEGSRDAVFISDFRSRFVFVNRAACELTGYSRDELLAMEIPDLHEDVDLEAYHQYHERIMGGDEVLSDARVLRKDGGKLDVEFSNRRISVSGVPYMHTAARDITRRKQVEEALRASEARFHLVARATNDAVWDSDLLTGNMWWNDSLKTLLGCTEEDIGPDVAWWNSRLAPEDRERVDSSRNSVIKGGGHYWSEEYRCLRADQSFAIVIDRGYVVYDDSGKPVRMIGSIMDITDRKRVEQALRESEEKYRLILESIEDGYYEVDLGGSLTFFNDSLSRILGYPPEELMGMSNRQYMTEENARAVYRTFNSTFTNGVPVKGFAYETIRKDGSTKFVECSVSLIKEDTGRTTGFRGIIRDITERKLVEQALRDSEERYRNLFENAPVGIYRTSPEGGILMGNPMLVRMLGYTSFSELARRNIEKEGFEPNYSREQFKEIMQSQGEVKGLEAAWTRHDGSVLFVRENARSVFGEGGELRYYEGTVEDISDRKRAETALRESEERFRLLIENSSDIVTIMDRNGAIRYISPSAKRVLGYSLDERIGHKPFELIHPADVEAVVNAHKALTEGSESIQALEYRYRHRDGSWRVLETMVKTLFDDSGAAGIVAYSRDITERKKAEEELKEFAAKLQRSNRELQEFAYVASHDLQEPLRKVLAFGDRLKARFADALDSEGLDYLERMRNATRRMQTLINDLLTLSRVTTQARPFVPVQLDELARDVLSDLEIRVEQVSGHVEVNQLPTVEADPIQMHQLFQNLISNALKFHRAGIAPEVKITSRPVNDRAHAPANSHNNEMCQIVVEDNGIGFDERHLDRIFTVFQRLHGRGEYEGTGIGLAICRKIVERHGGQITAASSPGEGASFIVTLPVKQPRAEAGI